MRGALHECPAYQVEWGIIPADAGSTKAVKRKIGSDEDHPRGCGEHEARKRYLPSLPGSSPRMRGALYCKPGDYGETGIIPADAGSTAH